MSRSHQTLSLRGLPLFSRVHAETPTSELLDLPPQACFVYILGGSGQALSESGEIVAEAGRAILSLCGLTVAGILSEHSEGSLDAIVVHFHRDLLALVFEEEKPTLWEELAAPVTEYVVQFAAGELVRHSIRGIVHLFENQVALTEDLLRLKLMEVVLLLLRADRSEAVRQIMRSLFSERTFGFEELVEAHVLSARSVGELAVATNTSLSTLKRRFREVYGTSPRKYMLAKRVERVASLLTVSDEPIGAVGYACGFESPEHLSRAFRRAYGTSPSQYRLDRLVK